MLHWCIMQFNRQTYVHTCISIRLIYICPSYLFIERKHDTFFKWPILYFLQTTSKYKMLIHCFIIDENNIQIKFLLFSMFYEYDLCCHISIKIVDIHELNERVFRVSELVIWICLPCTWNKHLFSPVLRNNTSTVSVFLCYILYHLQLFYNIYKVYVRISNWYTLFQKIRKL